MPNWVKHDFTIKAPKEVLDAFVNECFTVDGKGVLNLDFEKIIPKPAGFDATLVSPPPMALEALVATERRAREIKSFPWVAKHKPEHWTLDVLAAFLHVRKWPLSRVEVDAAMQELIELARAYARNEEIGGCPTWYEWNSANWGTKWNACDCNVVRDSADSLSLYFKTAWGSPEPIFVALQQRYPALKFSGTVDEEGGFFWFLLEDNEVVDQGDGHRPGGPYDYGVEGEDD